MVNLIFIAGISPWGIEVAIAEARSGKERETVEFNPLNQLSMGDLGT
jgi:hypothetical protein